MPFGLAMTLFCGSKCNLFYALGNNYSRTNLSVNLFGYFIKIAPENPVLWTEMKGVSAESRKKKQDAETNS